VPRPIAAGKFDQRIAHNLVVALERSNST